MTKRKATAKKCAKLLMQSIRELRMKLCEVNDKLDHLIKSYRKFYFTTDFSDSSLREFHH